MRLVLFISFLLHHGAVSAQDTIPLNDFSFWKINEVKNWQIVADVMADINKDDAMKASKGTGMLANLPETKNRNNLISLAEYGDVDVSFDFMMARNSNSGFYLQGRYEVQLLDSWGQQHPTFGDCAGVYARRRWNPEAQLFDGHAPRLNACLAPGLWQHLEISFQAPRFDAAGKKNANARLLKVVLNGVVVHENIELTGPTGGPISEQEAAKGPFMIQGDHGPVAFRNFSIEDKSGEQANAGKFAYKVVYGNFRYPNEFAGKPIDKTGTTEKLTWEVIGKEDGFACTYTGNFTSPTAGKHHLVLQAAGKSSLKINGKEVFGDQWTYAGDQRSADLTLPAGTHSIEIVYYKMDGWMPPFLGLWIQAPGARAAVLHSMGSALALEAPDPIGLDAMTPKVFRSFMDITLPNTVRGDKDFLNFKDPHRKRVVHAIQVGDPTHLHYTYDLDNGAIAQVWKGGFLNTSPMWDNRGDGSSRPLGAVLPLDDIQTVVPKAKRFDLTTAQNDPVDGFKPMGYDLDEMGYPTFRYTLAGVEVEDQIRVSAGKMLNRTINFKNLGKDNDQVICLAVGKKIEKADDGLWVVDDKRYFILVPAGAKPILESSEGLSVLYLPVSGKVEWSVLW
jgi:hypothetical protein